MRHYVVPTAVDGIHFVAAAACMCYDAAGMFGAAVVLVLPDIHCSLAVGAANAAVVGLAATVDATAAGVTNLAVSVVACDVAAGVATWFLSAAVLSKLLVFPVQIFPSPSALSLSVLFQTLFHLAMFYAARACMHLRTCGCHLF